MPLIVRVQIIRCDRTVFNPPCHHLRVNRALHADRRQIIMSADCRVHHLSVGSVVVKHVVYQKNRRIPRGAKDFPHQSLIGLPKMLRALIIDGKFHNYKVRSLRQKIRPHTRRAELRCRAADPSIAVDKLRLRKGLFPPCIHTVGVARLRCRGKASLRDRTADKTDYQTLPAFCARHDLLHSTHISHICNSLFQINLHIHISAPSLFLFPLLSLKHPRFHLRANGYRKPAPPTSPPPPESGCVRAFRSRFSGIKSGARAHLQSATHRLNRRIPVRVMF